MSNNIPKLLRLRSHHPTMEKFNKLCEYAEDLGISVEWRGQDVIIHDNQRGKDLPPIFLENIEEGHWFSSFPPNTEYKLVYDNPEYLVQKEKEQQEYLEQKRIAEEKARVAKEQAEQLRLKQIEESERFLLASLKAKYESC